MATLVASWGGNADTCYVTLEEADDYIGSSTIVGYKTDPTLWTDLTSIQKGRALLAATRDVDAAQNYIGRRQFYDQTLQFPRVPEGGEEWPWVSSSVTAANTYNVYLLEQKRRVKAATVEQAYGVVRDGERDEHIERQLRGITSFSETIGPISESASYGGTVLALIPESMEYLFPYVGYPALYRS